MNVEQRETMDSLINGLKSENVEIRKNAIENAVNSPDDEIVDPLIQLIQEPDVGPESREAAAIALAQMPGERCGEFLLQLICSDDPGLRVRTENHVLWMVQSTAAGADEIVDEPDAFVTLCDVRVRTMLIVSEFIW